MKIKGILTDSVTGEESEVDVETEIYENEGRRILRIIEGGVTGYESFYIDHVGLPGELKRFETDLDGMRERGWLACVGTERKWDRLFISGDEMKKALEGIEVRK